MPIFKAGLIIMIVKGGCGDCSLLPEGYPLIPKDGGDLTDNPLFSVPEGQVTNKDDPPGKRIRDSRPLS
ncbi:hypothetical protein CV014_02905 [Nostoc sp. CMAA1605]|nr:hypothetical protein [Nostoc sp. CMAA1605]